MAPERFVHLILLIVAVVLLIVLGVWAVGEITETDPGLIGPVIEGVLS